MDALRGRDGAAGVLDGRELDASVTRRPSCATVVGQGLDQDTADEVSGSCAGRRGRAISTVDLETRHGDKTSANGFDGYKGHLAIDPDIEIITATEVTPGTPARRRALGSCSPRTSTSARRRMPAPTSTLGACPTRSRRRRRCAHGHGDAAYGAEAAGGVREVRGHGDAGRPRLRGAGARPVRGPAGRSVQSRFEAEPGLGRHRAVVPEAGALCASTRSGRVSTPSGSWRCTAPAGSPRRLAADRDLRSPPRPAPGVEPSPPASRRSTCACRGRIPPWTSLLSGLDASEERQHPVLEQARPTPGRTTAGRSPRTGAGRRGR